MKKILLTMILSLGLIQPAFALNITVYPEADPATTATDGSVHRNTAATTWAEQATGNGTASEYTGSQIECADFYSGTTADTWIELYRVIHLFDTSAIGSGYTVSSSTLSINFYNKNTSGSVSPTYNIYTSNPASNTVLANSDFQTIGTVKQSDGDITYANIKQVANLYSRWLFNATGNGNVSMTGVSKFAIRESAYDAPNSAPPWANPANAEIDCYSADWTGTSRDPELSIDYVTAPPAAAAPSIESDFILFD